MKKHDSNKHKGEVLGVPFGTANNKLHRKILFNLIERCGLNICYRCNLEMDESDFSIEHIKNWEYSENPVELFFDIDNISFSHKFCNYLESGGRFINKNKTHCPKGHEYTEENTAYQKNPSGTLSRYCRKCKDLQNKTRHSSMGRKLAFQAEK